jgi:hypothetical protein
MTKLQMLNMILRLTFLSPIPQFCHITSCGSGALSTHCYPPLKLRHLILDLMEWLNVPTSAKFHEFSSLVYMRADRVGF